jgi:DNA repair photolyase
MPKIIVREIHARSVLVRSRIPGVSFAVNPYTGCAHGCAYCYAVFMHKYHPRSEGWGEYVDVKVNSPEVLERDVKQLKSSDRGTVLLSSVCDPYQPEEVRYRLTRRILAILLNNGFLVSILTKSSLITRDMDILRGFKEISAGLTITGLSEDDRRLLEPRASPHKDRINVLMRLKEAGIPNWAFIGPILPGLTDLEMIFRDLEGAVDNVMVDKINLKRGTWERFEPFLAKHYPRLLPIYASLYHGDREIWDDISIRVSELGNRHNIKARLIY